MTALTMTTKGQITPKKITADSFASFDRKAMRLLAAAGFATILPE